ncbi:MAG: nuclease, partial [Candidatus Rokuibacteriota bacterium]
MQLLADRLVLSPSDLNDYVECEHLTTLAREVAWGKRSRPHVANQYGELLGRKGEEHEAAYLAHLRGEGRQVVDVRPADVWDFEAGARATVEAMRAGVEIIYQATFVHGDWRGRADFLERVERVTSLGAWGYEAVDAKLARAEKPTYVLQLCFYSEAIEAIQGVAPEAMHVLLGIGERRTLRRDDYAAYYRRVRRGFVAALAQRDATEPYPVEHCTLCEFREVCDERWAREDNLSLVANIRREQVKRLRAGGIETLTGLARSSESTRIDHVAPHTFETLHEQAALQLARRATGPLEWRLLPVEQDRGFQRLPRPSRGDVVFDIEGDPFWEPARGLHFLLGHLVANGDRADGDQWEYRTIWSHDRAQERRAFEALIDFFHERLAS